MSPHTHTHTALTARWRVTRVRNQVSPVPDYEQSQKTAMSLVSRLHAGSQKFTVKGF